MHDFILFTSCIHGNRVFSDIAKALHTALTTDRLDKSVANSTQEGFKHVHVAEYRDLFQSLLTFTQFLKIDTSVKAFDRTGYF